MKPEYLVLLDTHIWVWWIEGNNRLPKALKQIIEDDNTCAAISAMSIYELAFLAQRGRINLNRAVDDWIELATVGADIEVLPVNADIARFAGNLPPNHGDPIDRVIIATALHYRSRLASLDSSFPNYHELDGCLIEI